MRCVAFKANKSVDIFNLHNNAHRAKETGMKRFIIATLTALMLLGSSGCITSDYNIRAIHDVDRYYTHSDSTSNLMAWDTPDWRTENVKYWSSAGVIITNPWNAFHENRWLKLLIEDGFEGKVFVEDPLFHIWHGEFGNQSYTGFLLSSLIVKSITTNIGNNIGPLEIVDTDDIIDLDDDSFFPYTNQQDILILNPMAWSNGTYSAAMTALYNSSFTQATIDIEDTEGKVSWGICLNDYTYQGWNLASAHLDSTQWEPIEGEGVWSTYTDAQKGDFIHEAQDYIVDAFYDAGIDIMVKGDRLTNEGSNNSDLLANKFVGMFVPGVTPSNVASKVQDINVVRNASLAYDPTTSMLVIAGVTNDIYYESNPTLYTQEIQTLVNAGVYFTPGANAKYFNVPLINPGDWWVRSDDDSNWQYNGNNPTYSNDTLGPRRIMGLTICEEPDDYTSYNFPSGAYADSGSVDFAFVYDDNTSLYHIIQIPGEFNNTWSTHPDVAFFEHYTSLDLEVWSRSPNIDMTLALYGEDSVWAPHVIKYDGTWYMFYTGVMLGVENASRDNIQRILLSTSADLFTWTTPTLVLNGDDFDDGVTPFTTWDSTIPHDWGEGDCRDPHVIRNETNDGWLMFVSLDGLSSEIGEAGGVIGIARSTSLTSGWKLFDYIRESAIGDLTNWTESTHVWVEDGTYYIQWTTNDDPVGIYSTTTTPSQGENNGATYSEPVAHAFKAMELLTLKNGDRIQAWLDDTAPINSLFAISFQRLTYDSDGNIEMLNLTSGECNYPFTAQTIPPQPTGLVATGGPETITLTWDVDEGDCFGYEIWRDTNSGGETLYDTVNNNISQYVDITVDYINTYYYTIKSINYDGTRSIASLEASDSPLEFNTNWTYPGSYIMVGDEISHMLDYNDGEGYVGWIRDIATHDYVVLTESMLDTGRNVEATSEIYHNIVEDLREINPNILVVFYVNISAIYDGLEDNTSTWKAALWDAMDLEVYPDWNDDPEGTRHLSDGWGRDYEGNKLIPVAFPHNIPVRRHVQVADSLAYYLLKSLDTSTNKAPWIGLWFDFLDIGYPNWTVSGGARNFVDIDQDGEAYATDTEEEEMFYQYQDHIISGLLNGVAEQRGMREMFNDEFLLISNGPGNSMSRFTQYLNGGFVEKLDQWGMESEETWLKWLNDVKRNYTRDRIQDPIYQWDSTGGLTAGDDVADVDPETDEYVQAVSLIGLGLGCLWSDEKDSWNGRSVRPKATIADGWVMEDPGSSLGDATITITGTEFVADATISRIFENYTVYAEVELGNTKQLTSAMPWLITTDGADTLSIGGGWLRNNTMPIPPTFNIDPRDVSINITVSDRIYGSSINIYRGETSGNLSLLDNTTNISYLDNDPPLVNGTEYFYALAGVNMFGEGALSDEQSTIPNPAPVAAFTGDPLTGTVPFTVTFTDLSTNTPTEWEWTFQHDTVVENSTLQNPTFEYTVAGSYFVILETTNYIGSDSEIKMAYITANTPQAPVAAFTVDDSTPTVLQTVQFTDQSTNIPTEWDWTFGDTGRSSLQNPTHEYQFSGTYTITLTATNATGEDIETKTDYIVVE